MGFSDDWHAQGPVRFRHSRSRYLPRPELHDRGTFDCFRGAADFARPGTIRLLRGYHRGALSGAGKAVRSHLDSVLLSPERTHSREEYDRGRRKRSQRMPDLGNLQLAGTRSLRHVWHPFRGASGFETHPAARWLEGLSASEGLRNHSTGSGMGARQPGNRERPIIMTDRTMVDNKTPDLTTSDTKTADATKYLSHLELGEPD